MTPDDRQAVIDEEHLRLLTLFHYISGALMIVWALLMMLWSAFVFTMFTSFPPPPGADADAARIFERMPIVMVALAGGFALFGVLCGVAEIVAARCISQRRARTFTIIASLPQLLLIPYGTILSALTFVVLDRRSVQELYRRQQPRPLDPGDRDLPPQQL